MLGKGFEKGLIFIWFEVGIFMQFLRLTCYFQQTFWEKPIDLGEYHHTGADRCR